MPSVHLFLFRVMSVWYFYKVLHAAVNYENFSDERRETIEIVDDVFHYHLGRLLSAFPIFSLAVSFDLFLEECPV